jgi:hypothetical protein
MAKSDDRETEGQQSEGCLVLLLRALAFGLGAGLTYAGLGVVSDYLVAGLAFLAAGIAVVLGSLFYRGPFLLRQKATVGALGLAFSLPVVLLVILAIFAISGLLESL